MFNRFSRAAREVVTRAVAEAARRGDRRVGTEHLLLGLLHDSAAAGALGVTLDTARAALQSLDLEALAAVGVGVDPGDLPAAAAPSTRHLPFTAAAKNTLVQTLREAVRLGSRRLEPRHLLLALLAAERPDPAVELVARLGVDPAVVRSRLATAA